MFELNEMRIYRKGTHVRAHALADGENLAVNDFPLCLLGDDDPSLCLSFSDCFFDKDAIEERDETLQRLSLKN